MDQRLKRTLKRKLDLDENEGTAKIRHLDLPADISQKINLLNSAFSPSDSDRSSAKRALFALSEFAKDGTLLFSFLYVQFDLSQSNFLFYWYFCGYLLMFDYSRL